MIVLFASSALAQQTITGTVVDDSNNSPLIGANVVVQGTTVGTSTDLDGRFSLQVAELPVTLVISFIGFSAMEVDVTSADPIMVRMTAGLMIDEMVVIGSRGRARTIIDSAVPIDNINAADLQSTGQRNIDQMINFRVPSYNSTNQTISDATAHFDPSELRNLGPSRTLVLVNGKRKNQSAQVYVNETPGRSEVGVDMKSIPASAIERIEVLRDGASAQYGSDAIAGVINIVLKERPLSAAELNLETGVTSEGDGFTYSGDINKGFRVGENGFINLTGSFYHQDYTNRPGESQGDGLFGFLYQIGAIPIEAALGYEATPGMVATADQILNGDTDFQRANGLGMIVGQPEFDKFSVYANSGFPHSNGEFYVHGGYTYRDGRSFALYRVPWWPGISGDPADNPLRNASEPYQGFQPTFDTEINDVTATVGNRFITGPWSIDVSGTAGSNSVDYLISNSINPALGLSSPTEFDPGGYSFGHIVGNVDVSRSFGAADLSFGLEARQESYEVRAGQSESYVDGGVQSFPGLQPENELDESRTNVGIYAGVDYDVSETFLIGGAARFEDYSDFGSNLSWKINARQTLAEGQGAIRASLGTGFRAPSLHQIYLSNIQTLVVDGNVSQEGTFNNVSDVTRNQLGIPQLDAETSFNLTGGVTYKLSDNFYASVDYYNVQVDDRVLFSNQISSSALPEGSPVRVDLENNGVEAFKFFVNALDTRTSGVDLVLNYNNIPLGPTNTLDLIFALNANKTELDGEINAPEVFQNAGIEIFNREEEARVTEARPDLKFSLAANLDLGKFNVSLNNTYFGEVTWRHPGDPINDQTFGSRVLTDLILGYDVSEKLQVDIIVNNLLNVYPDEIDPVNDFETDLGGRFRYPWEVNQFGFLGTILKIGATVKI